MPTTRRFDFPNLQLDFAIMTVAGIWENEYGSRMTLTVVDGAVSGTYDSSTGATGRYLVRGWQSKADPVSENGQPVALTIGWHSVDGGPPDAGWHWTSALGGQLRITNNEEELSVSHLLVATCAFTGLLERGIYIDKLTYRRRDHAVPAPRNGIHKPIKTPNSLVGVWIEDGGIELEIGVMHEAGDCIGGLTGTLRFDARELDIAGFTDINGKKDDVAFQSVAIAAVDNARNVTLALGGWIDDEKDVLTLQLMTNHATSAGGAWFQTTIWPLIFCRSRKA